MWQHMCIYLTANRLKSTGFNACEIFIVIGAVEKIRNIRYPSEKYTTVSGKKRIESVSEIKRILSVFESGDRGYGYGYKRIRIRKYLYPKLFILIN